MGTSSNKSKNFTDVPGQNRTNKGIKSEDLFLVLVTKKQDLADMIREQLRSGEIKYLNDIPASKRDMLDQNTFSLYKFSNELGTVNMAAHGTTPYDEKSDFLLDHGIQQHFIVLSVDEISKGSFYFAMNFKSGLKIFDESVVMINQIMYTFHRTSQFVLQNKTKETWYWSESDFKRSNPLLKYDFNNNNKMLFLYLIGSKTA
jgi:hypothetical protein